MSYKLKTATDKEEIKKREYVVGTTFVFKGAFFIKARNKDEAKEFVEKHCGMTLGRGIHTSLPYVDVDWDFPVHPDKAVDLITAGLL
jgi:hypothetical protein